MFFCSVLDFQGTLRHSSGSFVWTIWQSRAYVFLLHTTRQQRWAYRARKSLEHILRRYVVAIEPSASMGGDGLPLMEIAINTCYTPFYSISCMATCHVKCHVAPSIVGYLYLALMLRNLHLCILLIKIRRQSSRCGMVVQVISASDRGRSYLPVYLECDLQSGTESHIMSADPTLCSLSSELLDMILKNARGRDDCKNSSLCC